MNVTAEFAQADLDAIKDALGGGTLTIYSVARPVSADHPVERSGALALFTFATPAFGPPTEDGETPCFAQDAVAATTVGTPGFARAKKADGTVVADFSAGPGDREIKFAEVSCSVGAPVRIMRFRIGDAGNWPEKPEFYDTRPRTGYPMPRSF